MMVPFDQAFVIAQSIIDAAEVLRHRFLKLECDECGAAWHPREGKPPPETDDFCGHAHFREAYDCWDPFSERYVG